MNINKLSLPPITLGSTSPRRSDLLKTLGFSFSVVASDAEETMENTEEVANIVINNALAKAQALEDRMPKDSPFLLITADTVVSANGQVLGKPKNSEDVKAHLRLLSNGTHHVTTGVTLQSHLGKQTFAESTQVSFHPISAKAIEGYANTAEPHDKAGSYAIQGLASVFVKEIRGSYTNVVGFPIESFLNRLESATGVAPFEWFRQ